MNDQSARDISHVEAIYTAKSVTSATVGTGAAIYAWGTTGTSGLGSGIGLLNTLAVGAPTASVQIYKGDASCSGLALNTSANWVIRDGSFTQNALCLTINGNVTASGAVNMSSLLSTIKGNVSASSLNMSSTSSIIGNAWVTGASTFDNVLVLKPSISGTLTTRYKNGLVSAGTTSVVSAGPGASPYAPTAVPAWAEYDFTGTSGWPGYAVSTLTNADCTAAGVQSAIVAFGTGKGVIDAQVCTNGAFLTGLTISNLQNDIALIVPNNQNVQVGGIAVTAGSHNLMIVQPDADLSDGAPTCPAGGGITMSGINVVFPHLLVYTPCTYTENAGLLGVITFTGQIYAAKASLGNGLISARVQNYVAVGLPGVDLSTGASTATGPRLLQSQRNVASGP